LKVLSGNKNILTDETAIQILTASKEKSVEISEKQLIADETEKNIDLARAEYKEVSQEASCLFFAISDLVNIDPMYQYSLTYFIDLFTQAITKSEKSSDLKKRLSNLKSYFLYSLYSNICRSLFEKDKLLLSFLLCYRLMEYNKEISSEHFRFLLTGGVALDDKLPDIPHSTWITAKMWGEVYRLSQLNGFTEFYKSFYEYLDEY
jgi:dynein heavy chain, axonemal